MAAITLIMAAAKMTIAARFERLLSLVVGGTWSGFLAIRHRATPAHAGRRAPSSAIIWLALCIAQHAVAMLAIGAKALRIELRRSGKTRSERCARYVDCQ